MPYRVYRTVLPVRYGMNRSRRWRGSVHINFGLFCKMGPISVCRLLWRASSTTAHANRGSKEHRCTVPLVRYTRYA